MKVRIYIIFLFLAAISLTACVCGEPKRAAMDYGTSHNLAKFNQILDPDAEKNLRPVEGLSAGASIANAEKYRKSFERPEQKATYIFNVGR